MMDEHQLQGVEATGKVIGTGAYGIVIELKYKGKLVLRKAALRLLGCAWLYGL